MRSRRSGALSLLLVAALTAAACSSDDVPAATIPADDAPAAADEAGQSEQDEATDSGSDDAADTDAPPDTEQATADEEPDDAVVRGEASFEVRPGVEQVALLDGTPGASIEVLDAEQQLLGSGTVDEFGSFLLREIPGGATVEVVDVDANEAATADVLDRTDHPAASFFAEQRLPSPGFGYITTRDGTTLSANVILPGPVEDGPYPTVVEYSGYTPSNPDDAALAALYTTLGYAYVGVNMRGTGCSGGSFIYFEYVQSTDGYDVIEAVAAQPWVLGNRVGMVGVSYPGISQLFVAQTQPPNLAAITPFSVIDDSYRSTLYPGGILNTGFAVEWTQSRLDNARPEGQEWAANRIAGGDEECAANQLVRLQNPDAVAQLEATPFYDPAVGDEISPRLFVDQINVPTFIAGAWQDEQTGGRFPTMLDQFTGTDQLYASLVNGLHTESISPGVFPRLVEFLDLYVAERVPSLDSARAVAPILASAIYGTTEFTLPEDRFAGMTYEEALAAFESEPAIEVLFEQGAADGAAALAPVPRFVESFDSWPIPGVESTRHYLRADGTIGDPNGTPPPVAASVEYLAVPDGIAATYWDGDSDDLWRTDVEWDWQRNAPGTAAVFDTGIFPEERVMIGSASADLWVAVNVDTADTDIEVTLSELRPDGQEVYIQSGWLRTSRRGLDETLSTELRPVQTHLEADAAPLPVIDGPSPEQPTPDDLTLARVEIFPFAHVFRPGSGLRLTIDAPGGNRAVWVFDTIANGERVTLGIGGDVASSIVLPTVRGIDVPDAFPACDSLRGQPCRPVDWAGSTG